MTSAVFVFGDCTDVHYGGAGARTMTFESLGDPVDVLSAFVDGRMRPLRLRWQGRVIRVRRITGEWQRREGSTLLKYFSVESHADDTYELCYDPRGPRWIMSRAWNSSSRHGPSMKDRRP